MPDLRTITEIAPLVRAGAISPVTLVRGCLSAIEARPEVNAFITVLRESALEDAARAEEDIRAGRYKGPLHGIPIAVKDLIHIAGVRTTSGSALPSTEASSDAPVVQRMREAGAILIGKTNLHEFAFGTTSEESAYGPVRNPLDETRSAGGSSGGSAAALAAGMAFGALGTDTGGSVRIPSAACGTVGLKPAIGEISTVGVVPLSGTLDHVGPMARSVSDVSLMRAALSDAPADAPWETTGSLVFGVPRPYFCDMLDSDTADALARATDALVVRRAPGRGRGDRPRGLDASRVPAHRAARSGVVSRAVAQAARLGVLTRSPHSSGDGAIRSGGGLRAGHEAARFAQAARGSRARAVQRSDPADASDRRSSARSGDRGFWRSSGAYPRGHAAAHAALQRHGPSGVGDAGRGREG